MAKLYQQIVCVAIGTNYAPYPLIADLFLFCCDRDFLLSLSLENQLIAVILN